MSDKVNCSYSDCQEDWDLKDPKCLCGESDFRQCGNYIGKNTEPVDNEEAGKELISSDIDKTSEMSIPWSSSALGITDLEYISATRHPYIIGVIGQANSGKTTFLATLYMLLRSGKNIGDYSFAGSYTLLGWEKIAQFLTFNTHKKISFPPHTSANMMRVPGLLHLLLKDQNGLYKDVILTDAPGEWFSDWAKNAEDHAAIGAKWVDDNVDSFIIVGDCQAFKSNIGKERHSLMQIVERMKNTNNGRPVALAWTKSDQDLSLEIKERMFSKVKEQLQDATSYDIAVVNRKSDKEIEDILVLIMELLEKSRTHRNFIATVSVKNQRDYFFTIR